MFSRAAPTVLFTAFCLAVASAYVSGTPSPMTRPGHLSEAQLTLLDSYYLEMKLALQVGDHARFEELAAAQSADLEQGKSGTFTADVLPAPYAQLRQALMDGVPSEVDAILQATPGLDLNMPQGRYGAVPLFWATGNSAHLPAMLDILLAAGAAPDFAASGGYTVLHAMASPFNYYHEDRSVAEALEKLPPSLVRRASTEGLTPLHLALSGGQSAQVVALLQRGADPNAPPPAGGPFPMQPGEPPLMMANGDLRMVAALLEAGADPAARDANGRRVIDALSQGAREAERALQDRISASAAEEYDRQYAADYARARDMVRDALAQATARP